MLLPCVADFLDKRSRALQRGSERKAGVTTRVGGNQQTMKWVKSAPVCPSLCVWGRVKTRDGKVELQRNGGKEQRSTRQGVRGASCHSERKLLLFNKHVVLTRITYC